MQDWKNFSGGESGNYSEVKKRFQNSDGFMWWKNDNYQAYWGNLIKSINQSVNGIPVNDVENNPFFKALNLLKLNLIVFSVIILESKLYLKSVLLFIGNLLIFVISLIF